MSCPNSDPQFDKILSRYFDVNSPDYPLIRKRLFYMVCIFVRFALYSLVFILRDKSWMPYVVGSLTLFTMIHLYSNLEGRQWWSKKFQFIMAFIITIVCGIIILGVKQLTLLVPILLYLSLFGGLIQSSFVRFC